MFNLSDWYHAGQRGHISLVMNNFTRPSWWPSRGFQDAGSAIVGWFQKGSGERGWDRRRARSSPAQVEFLAGFLLASSPPLAFAYSEKVESLSISQIPGLRKPELEGMI